MFCRKCGKKIPDDSKFCPSCGETTFTNERNILKNEIKPDNISVTTPKSKNDLQPDSLIKWALLVGLALLVIGSYVKFNSSVLKYPVSTNQKFYWFGQYMGAALIPVTILGLPLLKFMKNIIKRRGFMFDISILKWYVALLMGYMGLLLIGVPGKILGGILIVCLLGTIFSGLGK